MALMRLSVPLPVPLSVRWLLALWLAASVFAASGAHAASLQIALLACRFKRSSALVLLRWAIWALRRLLHKCGCFAGSKMTRAQMCLRLAMRWWLARLWLSLRRIASSSFA